VIGGAAFAASGVGGTATAAVPDSPSTTTVTPSDDVGAADGDADDRGTPYTVAVTTTVLRDDSRDRQLTVTLRLPGTDDPVGLVLLVHGFAAAAADYDALADALATAGYAVASPDFPLSSSAAAASPTRDIVAQATDVSFVLDALLDGVTVPAAAGRLDPTRVAVVGHSDGAVTAAGVAFNDAVADPRIGAAVVLSGGGFGFAGSWFADETPAALLVVHGTADAVNPFAASTSLFDQASGAKWLVAVDGGSHVGPFTTDASVTDLGALVVTFLRTTLDGDPAAAVAMPLMADAGDLTLVAAA
jgi:dienelactone hydrolase